MPTITLKGAQTPKWRRRHGDWYNARGSIERDDRAWAIWQDLYIVWMIILSMSQVWEAIKDKIPIAQRHKSSVGFATTLEILFINSQ